MPAAAAAAPSHPSLLCAAACSGVVGAALLACQQWGSRVHPAPTRQHHVRARWGCMADADSRPWCCQLLPVAPASARSAGGLRLAAAGMWAPEAASEWRETSAGMTCRVIGSSSTEERWAAAPVPSATHSCCERLGGGGESQWLVKVCAACAAAGPKQKPPCNAAGRPNEHSSSSSVWALRHGQQSW